MQPDYKSPEIKLWEAVLVQCYKDAVEIYSIDPSRSQARSMIVNKSKHLEWICNFLGKDINKMSNKFKELLIEINPKPFTIYTPNKRKKGVRTVRGIRYEKECYGGLFYRNDYNFCFETFKWVIDRVEVPETEWSKNQKDYAKTHLKLKESSKTAMGIFNSDLVTKYL